MGLRKHVRYQVQCPVEYVLDGKPGQGTAFNLSRGGCAIEDPISLQLTVSSQAKPIVIELGMVRWATRREFGVEFMVLDNTARLQLDDFLLMVAREKLSS